VCNTFLWVNLHAIRPEFVPEERRARHRCAPSSGAPGARLEWGTRRATPSGTRPTTSTSSQAGRPSRLRGSSTRRSLDAARTTGGPARRRRPQRTVAPDHGQAIPRRPRRPRGSTGGLRAIRRSSGRCAGSRPDAHSGRAKLHLLARGELRGRPSRPGDALAEPSGRGLEGLDGAPPRSASSCAPDSTSRARAIIGAWPSWMRKTRAQLPDSAFAYIDSTGQRAAADQRRAPRAQRGSRGSTRWCSTTRLRVTAPACGCSAPRRRKHGVSRRSGFISAQLQPQRRLPKGPRHVSLLTDIERSTELASRASKTVTPRSRQRYGACSDER